MSPRSRWAGRAVRAPRLLVVGIVLAGSAWGCGSTTLLSSHTRTIMVQTSPAGAQVWRTDEQGKKVYGAAPVPVKVWYQTRTETYNRWWHWGTTIALGALAAGGVTLMAQNDLSDSTAGTTGLMMGIVGFPSFILGLFYGAQAELSYGQTVLPRSATIGASLPGHDEVWETVEVPGADPTLTLALVPQSDRSTPAHRAKEPGDAVGRPAHPQPPRAREVVAVFDLKDERGQLGLPARRLLTDALVAQLTGGGRYRVIPGARIRARLTQRKQRGARECSDEDCQLELGRTLAADKTLDTRILSLGERCRVTAVLYDLKTETADRAAAVHTPCAQEALLEAMDAVARELAGWRAGSERGAP